MKATCHQLAVKCLLGTSSVVKVFKGICEATDAQIVFMPLSDVHHMCAHYTGKSLFHTNGLNPQALVNLNLIIAQLTKLI